jgi:hemerythrin superfamily protein
MKKSSGEQQQAPAASIRMAKPMSILKEDHKKVTDLFSQFEKTNDEKTQREVAGKAIHELKIHAEIEEELFYPSVRKIIMDDDLLNEAAEEHHVVRVLMDEIDGPELEAPVFHAKFMVLAETVRHHIRQEEGQMFPKLARYDGNLEELGLWMEERKQELETELQHASKQRSDKSRAVANFPKVSPLNRPRAVR